MSNLRLEEISFSDLKFLETGINAKKEKMYGIKRENSLLYWQQPTTGPYSEQNDYISTPVTYVYSIYLNISPSKYSLSFNFPEYAIVYDLSFESIIKVFWRWCSTLRITGSLDLFNIRYSQKYRTQRFGNWICSRPQASGMTPTHW